MFNNQCSTRGSGSIKRIENIAMDKSCVRLNIALNGFKVKAVLDIGIPVSILSMKQAQKINLRNFQSKDKPTNYEDYNGNMVKLTDEFETPIEYKGKITESLAFF